MRRAPNDSELARPSAPSKMVSGLAILALVLLVAAVVFPVFMQRKKSGRDPCISSIKRVATAAQVYAADFDACFPLASWNDRLIPYKADAKVGCPYLVPQGKEYGYALNKAVVGKAEGSIQAPEPVVVFFETEVLERNRVAPLSEVGFTTRHGGGSKACAVAYADSYVRILRGEE